MLKTGDLSLLEGAEFLRVRRQALQVLSVETLINRAHPDFLILRVQVENVVKTADPEILKYDHDLILMCHRDDLQILADYLHDILDSALEF